MLTSLSAFAQVPVTPGPSAEAAPVANLSFEPVGPGDLLFIYVSNSAENSRSVRVSADGTISLPSLKDPLPVSGLLATEIEKVVIAALTANKILVEPIVDVSVIEYRSKPVTVVGAVKEPLTIQAIGNVHLLDAIAKAGGLAPEAGSTIIVSKPGTNGSPDSVQQIPVAALMSKSDPSLNLTLTGGEEVKVPVAGKFYVVGNVKTPGSYSITEGEGTTVLKALALSQGTLPFTQPEAFVYRKYPSQPGRQEISVPLKQIIKRQSADFRLEADDILYVPDQPGKRLTANVFDRVTGFGGAIVSGILIYANR